MADSAVASPAELLTTKQAAALCGFSPRTLMRWSRAGAAPNPIRLGYGTRATIRYRRADLTAWINEGCPQTEEVR